MCVLRYNIVVQYSVFKKILRKNSQKDKKIIFSHSSIFIQTPSLIRFDFFLKTIFFRSGWLEVRVQV